MKRVVPMLIAILISAAFAVKNTTPVYLEIPKNWPKTNYDFSKNPLTEQGFQLGRMLFYDPILSRDSTISCASCHLQAAAFTHTDHPLSHGIEGRIGIRNAPGLMNLAWRKSFMWDGGVNQLEVQPLNPITNPNEMDESLENVVRKLQKSENYKKLFGDAFGSPKVSGQRVLKALAQFTVMLISADSKYDRVKTGKEYFTAAEANGYELFKIHCVSCHREPLFEDDRFEINGLDADTTLNDSGRLKISRQEKDRNRFRIPTLRNIQYTYPYMHDGRFATLTEVVRHYNSLNGANLPQELSKPMQLSDNDRVDLVAFLKTLSDRKFVTDERFSFPVNSLNLSK